MPPPSLAMAVASVSTCAQVVGGLLGLRPASSEELPVVDQPLGVVGGRQAVQGRARLIRLERARRDVVEIGHGRRVHVLRDVGRLAGQQHLRQVSEVGVVEVGLGPGPQHRGERRRHRVARVVVDAVDGDVGVGLLEDGHVLQPLLVLHRLLCLGRRTVDADRHLACRAGGAAAAAAAAGCGAEDNSCDGGDRDYRAVAQSVTLSALHRSIPFLGLNVGDVRPRRCDESVWRRRR